MSRLYYTINIQANERSMFILQWTKLKILVTIVHILGTMVNGKYTVEKLDRCRHSPYSDWACRLETFKDQLCILHWLSILQLYTKGNSKIDLKVTCIWLILMKVCTVVIKIKWMWKKHRPGLHENKDACRLNYNPCWSVWQQCIHLIPVVLLYFKSKHLFLHFTVTFTNSAWSSWRMCARNFGMCNRLKERQARNEQSIFQGMRNITSLLREVELGSWAAI